MSGEVPDDRHRNVLDIAGLAPLCPGLGLDPPFHPGALKVEVVRTSVVIEIDPATIARVAVEFPQFRWFIAQQLASTALRMPSLIEEFAFKTVRQRVAGHLLALSTPRSADPLLAL